MNTVPNANEHSVMTFTSFEKRASVVDDFETKCLLQLH